VNRKNSVVDLFITLRLTNSAQWLNNFFREKNRKMKTTKIMYLIPLLILIVSFSITPNVYAQTNTPPTINILKPTPGLYFSTETQTFFGGA